MARRRLLWKLFPTYLALILLCSGATGLYAWTAFRNFYLDQITQTLQQRARIIRQQLLASPAPFEEPVRLSRFCTEAGAASGSRITIIDATGQVRADSSHDRETMSNHSDRPEFRQAMAGQAGVAIRHSNTLDADMLYVAVPVAPRKDQPPAGVVRVALPLTHVQEATTAIYSHIAIAVAVVVAVAGLAALLMSRRLSQPIVDIRTGAARFARGELDHRLYVPDTEEMAGLAESLNQMAQQLDEKISAITEQKAQQEAVLASMIEGVLAVDSQACVISLNEAAARLLDVAPPRPAGRSLREIIRNAELSDLVDAVLTGGLPIERELTLHREPDPRTVEVHATVLRDARDRRIGALLVLNDVTRLRRLERVRRDFVANVSHELKTPITSIKGFVETLRDGAIDEPQRASRFLEIISKQADRLNAIIEDLLSLSRIEQEAEKHEIALTPSPLCEVIRGAVQSCHLAAETRQIDLRQQCDASLVAAVNAPLLEQAVVNLIDNAIKYSEPGKCVQVSAGRVEGAVEVRVQDWGCGIGREHLPRLFERFYRVDRARSRSVGGTGLGLAIVKHIVNAHGGSVRVESTPGQGSTFILRLPAR